MACALEIFNLSDLRTNPLFAARGSSADAPFFAVLGQPIKHSLSPLMQNAALARIAETRSEYAKAKYFAFEISPADLPEALELFKRCNFSGLNLTIPHKELALRLADFVDAEARDMGACNTLALSNGTWRGYNTDGFGIAAAIESSFGFSAKGKNVFVCGAGGAARAIIFKMVDSACASLTILNRSLERMETLATEVLQKRDFKCKALSLSADVEIPENSIIINATSVGLKAEDSPVIDFSKVPKSAVFFDTPYMRGRETSSVLAAREHSIKAESGLAMLAWQGAKSLSIWTGAELMGELMLDVLREATNGNS